jgi:hypothetical protein
MQVSSLKVDHEKFYNNPDKTKQERYQAWLKLVAKDNEIKESIQLLTNFKPLNNSENTKVVLKKN